MNIRSHQESGPRRRLRRQSGRSWLGLAVPAALAFAVLIGLGVWQLQRKAWKEGLIASLTVRLVAAPQALPPAGDWPSLNQDKDEYRRVAFTAQFANDKEALVFATGTAFRPDLANAGPGYWVFTPARLADGTTVIVNRGFVPDGKQDPKTRSEGETAAPVTIVGAMRWPDTRHWFTPGDDSARNLWFVRSGSDRRCQGPRCGRAVLCRAGIAHAARRIAAAGQARREPSRQSPAICPHLVRPGGRPGRRLRLLGGHVQPSSWRRRSRRGGMLAQTRPPASL